MADDTDVYLADLASKQAAGKAAPPQMRGSMLDDYLESLNRLWSAFGDLPEQLPPVDAAIMAHRLATKDLSERDYNPIPERSNSMYRGAQFVNQLLNPFAGEPSAETRSDQEALLPLTGIMSKGKSGYKLERNSDPYRGDGIDGFFIKNGKDETVGGLYGHRDIDNPHVFNIENVATYPLRSGTQKNSLGPAAIADLLNQLQEHNPGITHVRGWRATGSNPGRIVTAPVSPEFGRPTSEPLKAPSYSPPREVAPPGYYPPTEPPSFWDRFWKR